MISLIMSPLRLGCPLDFMVTCIVGFVEGLGEYRSGDSSSGSSSVIVVEAEKGGTLFFIKLARVAPLPASRPKGNIQGATPGMSWHVTWFMREVKFHHFFFIDDYQYLI